MDSLVNLANKPIPVVVVLSDGSNHAGDFLETQDYEVYDLVTVMEEYSKTITFHYESVSHVWQI